MDYYVKYRTSDGYVVEISETEPIPEENYGTALCDKYVPGDEWRNAIYIYPEFIVDGRVTISASVQQSPPAVELLTKLAQQKTISDSLKVAAQIATRDLVKAEELSEEEYNALIGIYPAWEEGITYTVGELVSYNNKLYEVIQAHTSQADWTPDIVPALFTKREPAGVIPEWVQPVGAEDAYNLGDIVTHNGQTWISTVDANVWEPSIYGWDVYSE